MIDRIEYNIQKSVDYILTSNEYTRKAAIYQKEARKVSLYVDDV